MLCMPVQQPTSFGQQQPVSFQQQQQQPLSEQSFESGYPYASVQQQPLSHHHHHRHSYEALNQGEQQFLLSPLAGTLPSWQNAGRITSCSLFELGEPAIGLLRQAASLRAVAKRIWKARDAGA